MDRIAELMAPRGWFDGALKVCAFIVAIALFNYVIEGQVMGNDRPDLVKQTMTVTLVSLPFTIFGFWMLSRLYHLKRELRMQAERDFLTGLPNRRHFMAATEALCASGVGGLFLTMDADHFKRINDRHGHQVGDECLVAVAERLRYALRANDLKARMGGEEFAAFIPGAGPEEGRFLADRLTEEIRAAEHGKVSLTLSIGIAEVKPGLSISELYRRADEALYAAKRKGRARAEFWPVTEVEGPERSARIKAKLVKA